MPCAIDPARLTLADGRELLLYPLRIGALKRLKDRFGYKTVAELLDRDIVDCVPVLWEAVEEKTGLTEQEFEDLLWADLPRLTETLLFLLHLKPATQTGPPSPASPSP